MKKFKTVEDYVKEMEGKRAIKKILVSNNGLSALKGIRSMKQWCYETFRKQLIKFVVMATPEDLTANAEFIHHGDEVVQVLGGSNVNNYANVKLIVDIAQQHKCDAVWPGWGHASEYPDLPKQLALKGIQFIGPDCSSMNALGDKISSSIIAENAKVPTIPWSGSGIVCKGNKVTPEMYKKACIQNVDQAINIAKKIGYPVMVKASEGGGGKGIRKCRNEKELITGYNQVRIEVAGSPIFLMKLAENNRHLEVQVISDQYNNSVALYSRDCSVQRRHQKIIEEGPVTVAPRSTVELMEKAAVRLAKAVNYQNAGTVEYLYGNGGFFFLELNPRLQVEHPVTEWITGVNLPAMQLQVAMGIPLHRIPDIRKFYGKKPFGTAKIDFDNAKPVPPNGHTIACRITAENPENGFLGTSGSIEELTFQTTRAVWGYFSIRLPGGIHSYSDSQFGHIFAHGKDREEAISNMVVALSRLVIRGKVSNTAEYIMNLLEMETFKNNKHSTAWLDVLISEKEKLVKPDDLLVVKCGSCFQLSRLWDSNKSKFEKQISFGQYPDMGLFDTKFPIEFIYEDVKYKVVGYVAGENEFILELNNSLAQMRIKRLKDGGLLVMQSGASHVCYGREDSQGLRLTIDGKVCYFTEESDPSKIKAAVSGKVVKLLVEDGDHIKIGQPYIELEVMKMILQMKCENSGKIKFNCIEGAVIDQGDLLASLDLDDKLKVPTATLFSGKFNDNFIEKEKKPHVIVKEALEELKNLLLGYGVPVISFQSKLKKAVSGLGYLFDGDIVLVHQFVETLSIVRASVPIPLKEEFEELLVVGFYKKKDVDICSKLLAAYKYTEKYHFKDESRKKEFLDKTKPLLDILLLSQKGMRFYSSRLLVPLLELFINCERVYDNQLPMDKIMAGLREKYKETPNLLFENVLSHRSFQRNNDLICELLVLYEKLKLLKLNNIIVTSIASLNKKIYKKIVSICKNMLLKDRLPSFRKIESEIKSIYGKAVVIKDKKKRLEFLNSLINNSKYGFDVLLSFARSSDEEHVKLTLESYIRKAYTAFEIHMFNVNEKKKDFSLTSFKFIDKNDPIHSLARMSNEGIKGGIESPYPSQENLDQLEEEAKKRLLKKRRNISEKESETDAPAGYGMLALFKSVDLLRKKGNFAEVLKGFNSKNNTIEDRNVLSVLVLAEKKESDSVLVAKFEEVLQRNVQFLEDNDVRRVTIVLKLPKIFPYFFTFRMKKGYKEDPIYRHIEPTLAFQLELQKLRRYHVTPYPNKSSSVHVFYAEGKKGIGRYSHFNTRFFIRTIVFQGDMFDDVDDFDFKIALAEKYFVTSLDALEHAMSNEKFKETYNNHIFVNYVPIVTADDKGVKYLVSKFQEKYSQRLIDLRVSEVEMKINIRSGKDDSTFIPIRVFITNKTHYRTEIDIYIETVDRNSGRTIYSSLWGINKSFEGKIINTPYPIMQFVDVKRAIAHSYGTSYVYDFPFIFERAVKREWNSLVGKKFVKKTNIPTKILSVVELVLNEKKDGLIFVKEEDMKIGENKIGMIAWLLNLKTPTYPKGQDIILISNDITVMSGSFGPDEDVLFDLASKLSRKMKIPRIYITANSGARIGLAKEVKPLYKICWVDENKPSKGFKYIYLTPKDYEKIKKYVKVKEVVDNGEKRYKIVDIIGKQHGIGVECLQGSGMIAGETSRAYKEVFTLSYVAQRTVGIGAYLVRLGQRIIQHVKPPIILTGASALNKLLGKNVYVSHNQLGGTQIMYPNGVTHLVAKDDIKGVSQIVQWLSYIPAVVGSPLPIMSMGDKVNRKVEYLPSKNKDNYNPRDWIQGKYVDGKFLHGLFDKESFFETLKGWATSIVVGRARLGGIPMGIIAVETQTKTEIIPADPADDTSKEQHIAKAGQVWFPDSAYKTAQAIWDFNNGEQLPLMIFANWRGFSGGQRDMFKEILKYGSYIVDALVDYKQPIFIYIPPFAELRGGAWVVVDPKINSDCIEMYADTRAKGGVLEPSGTVEIKYKKAEVFETIKRLDREYLKMKKSLEKEGLGDKEKEEIEKKMEKRLKDIFIVYHNIALHFADLHDTPGRMKAKNVIFDVIPMEDSRQFFYWRLKRKLVEFDFFRKVDSIEKQSEKLEVLRKLVNNDETWKSNEKTSAWYEKNKELIAKKVDELKKDKCVKVLEDLLKNQTGVCLETIINHVKRGDLELKKKLLNGLITAIPQTKKDEKKK